MSRTGFPRLRDAFRLEHVDHLAPPPARFWVYTVGAYLMPVVAAVALPRDPGLYDELVWLVTLVPAFLLSLHYGLRGALVGLLTGTVLFLGVTAVVAFNQAPYDLRITVPIYLAFGVITISVGWLSQELHDRYRQALERARLAVVGQLALTIRHQLNNALGTIVGESEMLAEMEDGLTEDQRQSARSIHEAALKISADVRKLTNLESTPVVEYPDGQEMLDLPQARERPGAF
jgi:signal transduction histidine kinase